MPDMIEFHPAIVSRYAVIEWRSEEERGPVIEMARRLI